MGTRGTSQGAVRTTDRSTEGTTGGLIRRQERGMATGNELELRERGGNVRREVKEEEGEEGGGGLSGRCGERAS